MSDLINATRTFFGIFPFITKILMVPFFVIVPCVHSQTTDGNYLSSNIHNLADEIIKPSVQSPDVAAFQKNNFLPTSNFSGRIDVSIPIYIVQHGGMEVPIYLSYNTSGVKVADMASRVGLNWSLNAGGVVSKVIQGLDDFTSPEFLGHDVQLKSSAGWLAHLSPNFEPRGEDNPNDDALPDKYIVRAPGLDTEFVFEKDGDPLDLRRSGNRFNPSIDYIQRTFTSTSGNQVTSNKFALKRLEVVSIDGIQYEFETPDFTNGQNSPPDVPTHHLDRMLNLNTNEQITFEYESFSNHYADETKLHVTYYGGGSREAFADEIKNTWFNLGNRITKIDFQTGSVVFLYNHERQDYPGEKALTQIVVKDIHGKIIKDFRLSHSYFQSSIETGTPESKRLKLDSVYEVDNNQNPKPGYNFNYETNINYSMPPRDSYAYDFLGYNNGSYSSGITDPIPKMYFYGHKVTPLYLSTAIELPGNFSMAANLDYSKVYSLKKIELPTGGFQEFDYELNQFVYKGKTFFGGGLRVKTQYLQAGDGTEQILDYVYSHGTIGLMPSYASFYVKTNSFSYPSNLTELTNQLGIDTFSSPSTQVELNNGSFVAYQSVDEIRRNAPGYTTYVYSLESNTPSTKNNPSVTSLGSISNLWRNLNDGLLFIDNDFMRGILLSRIVYDSNDKMVHLTRNAYELQESNTGYRNQVFYNVVNNGCSEYDSQGNVSPSEKFGNCGGFKEVIDLKPSRYVLNSVRTTDYALDGEDPMLTREETQGIFVEKKFLYHSYYPLITYEFVSNYESDEQFGKLDDPQNALWESSKRIVYPVSSSEYSGLQVNSYPFAQELYNQNRISVPMEIEISGRSYSKQFFEYADFGGGLINLKKVKTQFRDNAEIPAPEVLSRNVLGRPTEIKQIGGKIVSIIYGYNYGQIIAIVDGASYSNMNSWLYSDHGKTISYLEQLSNVDKDAYSESSLKTWLSNLKTSIESRSGNTTTVITFTHDPLVGTTSVTDERGITTTYGYDQLDRLELIKNDDSQIMKYINYNFKN